MRPPGRAALAAAGTVAAALGTWAGWIEPRRLVVRELEFRLPHWPAALDGVRAGVLSDLHAGVPHAGLGQIARAVGALNAADVDLHLLLGDYLDASQAWRRPLTARQVARELGRLRSPLGTYAVIGNHDWRAAGWRVPDALVRAGVRVLEDDAAEIVTRRGRFWVAGLADLRYRRPDMRDTLAPVPPGEPVILLSHSPDVFPAVPDRVALTLAGHTHGGQLSIPGLRLLFLPSRYGERFRRGHKIEAGRHLHVTSGVGTSGLPVRWRTPPEVLVITLRPA